MQMRNWLVSTVLGLGLIGGAGCAPEELPTPAPSPEAPSQETTPQQERSDEDGTVTAMAASVITWADLEKTTTTYTAKCVTSPYNHTCNFCASSNIYYAEYHNSGCTSPWDVQHTCVTCDRQVFTSTARVELSDGDLIDVTIEHGVTAWDGVEFKLESGPDVTWWKQVTILGGGESWRVWNQDGNSWCDWPYPSTSNCNTNSQWASIVAGSDARFVFSKAKGLFATHTDMYVLYNLSERLSGGDRVTFRWVRD